MALPFHSLAKPRPQVLPVPDQKPVNPAHIQPYPVPIDRLCTILYGQQDGQQASPPTPYAGVIFLLARKLPL